MGTGGGEKGVTCLVIGEYNAMSLWRGDVYDGTGDGGIEINAFCSIVAILGSMASSLFTTCRKRQCIAWIDSVEERETGI